MDRSFCGLSKKTWWIVNSGLIAVVALLQIVSMTIPDWFSYSEDPYNDWSFGILGYKDRDDYDSYIDKADSSENASEKNAYDFMDTGGWIFVIASIFSILGYLVGIAGNILDLTKGFINFPLSIVGVWFGFSVAGVAFLGWATCVEVTFTRDCGDKPYEDEEQEQQNACLEAGAILAFVNLFLGLIAAVLQSVVWSNLKEPKTQTKKARI